MTNRRGLSPMKDAVVLAFLRSRFDEDPDQGFTVAQIRDGLVADGYEKWVLWNEEAYNSLRRLADEGHTERHTLNSRVVLWRATRGEDGILVREPRRTIQRP